MEGGTETRAYRMGKRAESTDRTRQRILDAAIEIGDPRVPIDRIAFRAGVSSRTILRHFGDRSGIFAAAMERADEKIGGERFAVPAGDLGAAVANLVEHYDVYGDGVMLRLGEEGTDERIDRMLANGRRMHRRWVEEKLGPLLSSDLDSRTRRRRIAQMVAVCDVYTWKLLRRDSGLGAEETERAIAELIRGLTGEEPGR